MEIKMQGILHRATPLSAGYDLAAVETAVIMPGQRQCVNTGVRIAPPAGVAALVVPRSGLALKRGITILNAPGLIDPDYRGDIGVILHNTGDDVFNVFVGDRIAQLMFVPFCAPTFVQAGELEPSVRGAGGFGSTGL